MTTLKILSSELDPDGSVKWAMLHVALGDEEVLIAFKSALALIEVAKIITSVAGGIDVINESLKLVKRYICIASPENRMDIIRICEIFGVKIQIIPVVTTASEYVQ